MAGSFPFLDHADIGHEVERYLPHRSRINRMAGLLDNWSCDLWPRSDASFMRWLASTVKVLGMKPALKRYLDAHQRYVDLLWEVYDTAIRVQLPEYIQEQYRKSH